MLEREIIAFRRHIHKNPELGLETYQTAAFIYHELEKMGYQPVYVCHGAGVVARLDNQKKKTIAFRSDLDALKIEEKTDLEYRSTNGCMHACGHDAHCAMLLGAAKLLMSQRNELKVNVILLFQPAEEGPLPGGSIPLMQEYDLTEVSCFFAFHVTNKLKTGEIGMKLHEACAAPDLWECQFTGIGCHGATPKLGINPILPACEAVLSFQRLFEDLQDPYQVISTTYLQSGVSMNIISDTATIKGTARSFTPQTRKNLDFKMHEIAHQIAEKYHVKAQLQFHYAYDPVYNDDMPASYAKKAIEQVAGKAGFIELQQPEMVGEDFSHYRRIAPTCLCWLGVRGSNQPFYDLHSPSFVLDESAMILGSKIFLEIAKIMDI